MFGKTHPKLEILLFLLVQGYRLQRLPVYRLGFVSSQIMIKVNKQIRFVRTQT